MPVDMFGHSVEWPPLLDCVSGRELLVIDDACEALGGEYRGKRLGCFGEAAAFAFYPNKQITTGEGGMIVTDRDDLARLARSLRNQGRDEMGAWLAHPRLGYNYRMDEMSAALGVTQIARLEDHLRKRDAVANLYGERLEQIAWLRKPVVRPHVRMAWFVYVVTLEAGLDRDALMAAMEARGIPVRGYFPPVHLQPYVGELDGTGPGALPVTESIARRTVALPFHNRLTESEVDRVVDTLRACEPTARGGNG